MSWLSCLSATGKPEAPRQFPRLAPWACRRAESAADRAARASSRTGNSSGRAPPRAARIERPAARAVRPRGDIMAGRQNLGAEVRAVSRRSANLIVLVAVDAGHRRLARDVALRRSGRSPFPGTRSRSRARNGECRAARPPGGRHECPGRRSRRPCDGSAAP